MLSHLDLKCIRPSAQSIETGSLPLAAARGGSWNRLRWICLGQKIQKVGYAPWDQVVYVRACKLSHEEFLPDIVYVPFE